MNKTGFNFIEGNDKKTINKVDTLEYNGSNITKPVFPCKVISVLIYSVITLPIDHPPLGKWEMEEYFLYTNSLSNPERKWFIKGVGKCTYPEKNVRSGEYLCNHVGYVGLGNSNLLLTFQEDH